MAKSRKLPPLEYARLAEATYEEKAPPGWKVIDREADEKSGYYGMAVRHEATGETVIVHRGTQFADKRDWQDDARMARGKQPEQLASAERLSRRVSTKHPDILHVGHSLGASIAQLCAAGKKIPGKNAVTFDAYGIKHLIEEDPARYNANADIESFLFSPNVVNSHREQFLGGRGEVYHLKTPHHSHAAEELISSSVAGALGMNPVAGLIAGKSAGAVLHTLNSHSISNALEAFNDETGEPHHIDACTEWFNSWDAGLEAVHIEDEQACPDEALEHDGGSGAEGAEGTSGHGGAGGASGGFEPEQPSHSEHEQAYPEDEEEDDGGAEGPEGTNGHGGAGGTSGGFEPEHDSAHEIGQTEFTRAHFGEEDKYQNGWARFMSEPNSEQRHSPDRRSRGTGSLVQVPCWNPLRAGTGR